MKTGISAILARPKQRDDCYPWRPMDNREKRAAWATKYYLRYPAYEHPTKEGIDSDG